MGFFDNLLSSLETSSSSMTREKYRQMSREELEREWERVFRNKPYTAVKEWRENSMIAILDEEYSERFRRTSWYDKARRELRAEEQRERERLKEAEEKEQFKKAIEKSEMVTKLVEVIDNKQYEAEKVLIGNAEAYIFNGGYTIQTVTYKKFGYPNLQDYQISILTDHLVNRLALKFVKVSHDTLELNDAPGGMKSSW